MRQVFPQWLGRSAVGIVAIALIGCGNEAAVGPDGAAVAASAPAVQAIRGGHRGPDLTPCDSLAVPAGNRLTARLYARGTQIYRWDGAAWIFVAPSARLYPNRYAARSIGSHYAGPTWESIDGSKVVGAVMRRCPADPTAVPWLLLSAVPSGERGLFRGVTYIQRVNTVGGVAPAQPGTSAGETDSIPYTAEYLFYRAR